MMRQFSTVPVCFLLLFGVGWFAGCTNHRDSLPASKSYVDFVMPAGDPLWPEVHQWDARKQAFTRVYSKLKDPKEGIVRLEVSPGENRFKVYLLNESTLGPAAITIAVPAAKVVPVFLHVAAAGETLFERRDRVTGGNYRGRFGRTTQYSAEQSKLFELRLVAGEPAAKAPGAPVAYPAQTP